MTLVPTAWLVVVTLTGSWQKMFHEDFCIGFLAQASLLEQQVADRRMPGAQVADTRRLVFNNRLDAAVTGFFALLILALLAEACVLWYRILARRKPALLTESPYVRTKWAEGSP
jgi:carbon starvation protein